MESFEVKLCSVVLGISGGIPESLGMHLYPPRPEKASVVFPTKGGIKVRP